MAGRLVRGWGGCRPAPGNQVYGSCLRARSAIRAAAPRVCLRGACGPSVGRRTCGARPAGRGSAPPRYRPRRARPATADRPNCPGRRGMFTGATSTSWAASRVRFGNPWSVMPQSSSTVRNANELLRTSPRETSSRISARACGGSTSYISPRVVEQEAKRSAGHRPEEHVVVVVVAGDDVRPPVPAGLVEGAGVDDLDEPAEVGRFAVEDGCVAVDGALLLGGPQLDGHRCVAPLPGRPR